MAVQFYKTKPLLLGIEVFGINLSKDLGQEVIQQIKKDVTRHRIVVFRNQGQVSGKRQAEISRWFGKIDNTTFLKHPASPSVDVFCVSNDPEKGCPGVGTSGWHIDGTFRASPYSYSIYHMFSVPEKGGDTMFIPLTEIIESLPQKTREKLDRLSMVSDRRENIAHPLIYSHPKTGRPTMCFHLGMITSFAVDYNKAVDVNESVNLLDSKETAAILQEIKQAIKSCGKIYSHEWQQEGDFIISDNLAVGHQAGPIPDSLEEAGLRILHRVTVMGTEPPSKTYSFDFSDIDCAY